MAHTTLDSATGSPGESRVVNDCGAATSLPNSQNSSLNDSLHSQQSQHVPGLSTKNSRLSVDTHFHGAMTPSTSLSNKSSQEIAEMEAPLIDQNANLLQGVQSPNVLASRQMYYPFLEPGHGRINANKRMANGEIKSPGHSLPTSPTGLNQYGHSRNSSSTSRGSQISDLSSQLRTRLSYAMVKVQNGWQSHNINELEFITSNQVSPTFAPLDRRRPFGSLPVNGLTVDRGEKVQPPACARVPREENSAFAQKSRVLAGRDDLRNPEGGQSMPTLIGASYETFWREHEGSSSLKTPGAKSSPSAGPSLAPPADIVPRNARHADAAGRVPPPLHTRGLHSADGQARPISLAIPATPPPKKPPKLRTLSQQAAVEKDAVETLLFMSSPGNSGYHPPVTMSGTPLRSTLAAQASQTDHLSTIGQHHGRPVEIDAFLQQNSRPKPQLSDAEIDKMLDEMPETSSSDDDDLQGQRLLPSSVGR